MKTIRYENCRALAPHRNYCDLPAACKRRTLAFWQILFCLCLLLMPGKGLAQITVATDVSTINDFQLYRSGLSGLYWTAGTGNCQSEFLQNVEINLISFVSGYVPITETPSQQVFANCSSSIPNVVRDGGYFYFADNATGRIYKKAINLGPAAAATEIVTPYTPVPAGATLGAVTLWNGVLYWSYSSGGSFLLFWVNTDGSDPEYFSSGSGGPVTKMVGTYYRQGASYTNAIFALTGGNLMRINLSPGSVSTVPLATGVSDFTIRDEAHQVGPILFQNSMVYATTGFYSPNTSPPTPGKLLAIDPATGSTTTIYDNANNGNNNQLFSVTVDNQYLFFSEAPVVCGGSPFYSCNLGPYAIKRQQRPADTTGNANPFVTIANAGQGVSGGDKLQSDGRAWLYFRQTKQISRLPRDQTAISFDMQADHIEVVQTTQNLNNNVRLVTTKPTFVRGYAHVAVNTTGNPTFYPQATLTGTLNGVSLGAPISSLNNTMIDITNDLPTLRANLNRSFLFRLPDSWVQNPGNLVVTMLLDPDHLLVETGNLPNTISSPAMQLVNGGTPCLVVLPVSTYSGPMYWAKDNEASFNAIIDRATKLLPIQSFHVSLYNEALTKPKLIFDPLPDIVSRSYTLPDENSTALTWLSVYAAFQNDPDGCSDTHFVGALPPSEPSFNGVARRPGNIALVAMRSGGNVTPGTADNSPAWQKPWGGFNLAHELGHNYGAQHVNNPISCSSSGQAPLGPYANYPYPPCTMDPGPIDLTIAATYYGFDPLSQAIIVPTSSGPGDLMSYVTQTWMADTSISFFLGAIPAASFAVRSGPHPLSLPPSLLLIHGTLDPATGQPLLLPFYQLPANIFDSTKVMNSLNAAVQQTNSPYRVVLLDQAGVQLSSTPLVIDSLADDTVVSSSFLQFLSFDPNTKRIQIIDTNNVAVGERRFSPHAPSLKLNAPTIDPVSETLNLDWAASDADGDPLLFIVQYSPDGGNNWETRKAGYPLLSITMDTSAMPGGTNALIRVVATDGANSTVATTAPFTLTRHAPQFSIGGVSEGQSLPFGNLITLSGMGFDAEDGGLPSSALSWNLTGATPGTATGGSFPLADLTPGSYSIALSGTDTDGQSGSLTVHFVILPMAIPDRTDAPLLDGMCADLTYAGGVLIRFPLANGQIAPTRLVHCAGNLYVSFSDLPYATNGAAASVVGLQFGPVAGTGYSQNAEGFYVDENGLPFNYLGTAHTNVRNAVSPFPGYAVVISRGANSWSAEMQIPDSLMGGWNHAERLMLSLNSTHWPLSANTVQSQTWPQAYFGTPAPVTASVSQPVANAGPNRTYDLAETQTVFLDGSTSFDPNGFALSYSWTQVSGSSVTLTNALTVAPSFTGATNATATLGFQLVVSNGSNSSAPAQVQVTLKPASKLTPALAGTPDSGTYVNGVFQAELMGSGSNGTYLVQASTNLFDWVNIQTNMADFYGHVFFTDPQQQNYKIRFYRLKTP